MKLNFREQLAVVVGLVTGLTFMVCVDNYRCNEIKRAAKDAALKEINYLMTMPVGSLYMSQDTGALWSRVGPTQLSYMLIPDADIAQIVTKYSPATSTTVTTTTTVSTTTSATTLVGGKK